MPKVSLIFSAVGHILQIWQLYGGRNLFRQIFCGGKKIEKKLMDLDICRWLGRLNTNTNRNLQSASYRLSRDANKMSEC